MSGACTKEIKFDTKTEKWMRSHIGTETTVVECKECRLMYKPSLGHTCAVKKKQDGGKMRILPPREKRKDSDEK